MAGNGSKWELMVVNGKNPHRKNIVSMGIYESMYSMGIYEGMY